MRRTNHLIASAIALATLGACSTEQALSTAKSFEGAKQANRAASANSLAGSALAAQGALYHLATALSSQVAKDGKAKAFRLAQAEGPSYDVNLAAGTGTVLLMRSGKKAIDLRFKFDKEQRDGGLLYNVSALRGTAEGFQVLLPRLLMAYAPARNERGEVEKDAQGDTVFQVSVKAHGFLGLNDQPAFQIADLSFGVRYPFPAGETRLGGIKLFAPDGLVFDGEAYLAGQAVTAKGTVSDASGTRLYTVAVDAGGLVDRTPVASP